MRSIAQVRAKRAMRARARDVALVSSLGALAVGMCVCCAMVLGARPDQVQPVAYTGFPTQAGSALPVIPAKPVTMPAGVPALGLLPDQPDDVGPAGGTGSGAASALAADGIPKTALDAYRHAQAVLAADQPSCHLDWSLVAALARVESNHGRFGGAVLLTSGLSVPPIRGPRLDGQGGVALIRDTDHGVLDGDPVYDRAIGPLQFLPSTWRAIAGNADPYNIADAAVAAGIYLCSGSTNLADPAALRAAVFRYNHSDSYVSLVLSLAARYRAEVTVVDSQPAPPPTTRTTTHAPAAPTTPRPTTTSSTPAGTTTTDTTTSGSSTETTTSTSAP